MDCPSSSLTSQAARNQISEQLPGLPVGIDDSSEDAFKYSATLLKRLEANDQRLRVYAHGFIIVSIVLFTVIFTVK